MRIPNRLDKFLRWIADRSVPALLVFVLALGLVTAPAALAAGVRAVGASSLRESVPDVLRAFGGLVRRGLAMGAAATTFAASAIIAMGWASRVSDPTESVLAYVCAAQGFVGAVTITVFGAAALDSRVAITPRNIVVLLASSPGAFVRAICLATASVAVTLVGAPVLNIPIVWLIVLTVAGIKVIYHRRVAHLGAEAVRPTNSKTSDRSA